MSVIHGGTDSNEEHQPVGNGVNDLSKFAHLIESTRDVAIDPVRESQRTKEPTTCDNAIVSHQTHIRWQHGETHN